MCNGVQDHLVTDHIYICMQDHLVADHTCNSIHDHLVADHTYNSAQGSCMQWAAPCAAHLQCQLSPQQHESHLHAMGRTLRSTSAMPTVITLGCTAVAAISTAETMGTAVRDQPTPKCLSILPCKPARQGHAVQVRLFGVA